MNVKFYENPSSGSRVVPYRLTDMTKIIVAFSQFCERAYKQITLHLFIPRPYKLH